jgi:predicted N-acetyltransferase YhbS
LSSYFRIRNADLVQDNAALCELARRCPQGKRFRFYHQRDQFNSRGRYQIRTRTLVAENNAAVVATVSAADKAVWLRSCAREALYLYDLMVDPRFRGNGLAQLLMTEACQLPCASGKPALL